MAEEINLTYETLFETLIREKSRDELQKLDSGFLESVSGYVNEKRKIVISQQGKADIFSSHEREKTLRQLDNISRILGELYDRREKKIMNIAMISSRTSPSIIDKSAMLDKERELFNEVASLLKKYREDMLLAALNPEKAMHNKAFGAESDSGQLEAQVNKLRETGRIREVMGDIAELRKEPAEKSGEEVNIGGEPSALEISQSLGEGKKRVLITHDVPKFVGKELEFYGPFGPGEEAIFPSEIADILINKGRAKEI